MKHAVYTKKNTRDREGLLPSLPILETVRVDILPTAPD